ncbi:bacillithiol biosynthesis cysteine-adding enzyme BshC [Falsibacillus pallidus]|uniref:Putative cysteine ligase BshC n=1 Tax=Falsibacillus pallidus TaxID=493781 RepID=A0A370GVN1_9BACI|nr:bacillithiol biosynthesis cysteine-adding enzyme BshC [Falsibacillus pallidus]RDI47559.1 bacillithiol biosynthesis cysteine-adding enzyme BshC [Falsibacillus pallidus]
MELVNISIPAANQFASHYLQQTKPVVDFFHYNLMNPTLYKDRLNDLSKREFKREELADCIKMYMEPFANSPQIQESLRKLKHPQSSVVIGGQQAGVLTGPLYTIHKIISTIKLSKEQEEELGSPVVPVFWIAGEDHDFAEVNHVYAETDRKFKKISMPFALDEKMMISDVPVEQEDMKKWIKKVFQTFGETSFTKEMVSFLNECIERSISMVDFFSHIVAKLFHSYGLLMIDSAYPGLRKLELPFNSMLIKDFEEITSSVLSQQVKVGEAGFPKTLDIGRNAVNLFYYEDKERVLLEYDAETKRFIGKNGSISFTKEELLQKIEEKPERISNNVVTRPIMQELLFPTMAFIAGPGEIAYWAELKKAFEQMDMKMPPIVPRLNITLLDRAVESEIEDLKMDASKVLRSGTNEEKKAYWNGVKDHRMEELLSETESWLSKQYEMLEKRADQIDPVLKALTDKNLAFHLSQVEFLKRKTTMTIQQKHDVLLEKYDRIERALRPMNSPQERIWNAFYFFNKYGFTLMDQLMELPFEFDGTHKLIKL